MKKIFSKQGVLNLRKYIITHKIISGIVIIGIAFGLYKTFHKTTTGETLYTLGVVKKGLIISTVSASGQVSATDQVDVKAKVSGDITWVAVKPGDVVYAGQVLATIDDIDARSAVTDAQTSLDQSKLQLQKDTATAPIDYQKSLDNLDVDKQNLETAYNDTFNTISDTYLNLPTIVTNMQNILYGYDLSPQKTQVNMDVITNIFNDEARAKVTPFSTKADLDYKIARPKYDASILKYKQISRTSEKNVIESFLDETIDTTTAVAQTLQSELNFIGTVIDVAGQYDVHLPTTLTTMQTNTRNNLSTINSNLSSLLAQKKTLTSNKQAITTDEQNITLLKVGNPTGDNPISLQISKTNITKQEQNLESLKRTLADHTVVAPFAGTISTLTAKKGDSAGTIASLITKKQVATLSLNELDAVKIKLGNKAVLSFDAIENLSLTGTVEQIDSVGTVSQGVVSYSVKIIFDTQDDRVRPGMTVNASIQTAVHQDVLYVPSSSVKTANGQSYVEAFNQPITTTGTSGVTSPILPTQIPVKTGISDDTNIEILDGLVEGEQLVTRKTLSTAPATTATAPSATSLLGGGAGRGGNATFRVGN